MIFAYALPVLAWPVTIAFILMVDYPDAARTKVAPRGN